VTDRQRDGQTNGRTDRITILILRVSIAVLTSNKNEETVQANVTIIMLRSPFVVRAV